MCELRQICVGVAARVPAGGPAVATRVGGHDVEAMGGEGEKDLAPGEGKLWVAVEEQNKWLDWVAGFEHEDFQAAGGLGCEVDVPLPYAG